MNQLLLRGVITVFLIGGLILAGGMAQAQETNEEQSSIEVLQQQVDRLQKRISELRSRLQNQATTSNEASETTDIENQFTQQLQSGDRGSEVKRLQEILSTSEEIYPEGLTTGYYGPLTESAVARLQAKLNLPSVGNFDEQTRDRVNQLLKKGAGNSGMVPPGLLKVVGIQDQERSDSDDVSDEDKAEETANRVGPNVENLPISERIKERLRSIFDRFNHNDRGDDNDLSDAEDAIVDAEEEITKAAEDIAEEKEDGDEVAAAEARLKEAQSKLDEARTALDEGQKQEAEDLAEEAEDMAGEARMKYLGKTTAELEDEFEIEAEAEDGETEVEIEYRDGAEEELRLQTTDRSEVITRLVEETDLSRSEIQDVLKFEIGDEADEDSKDDQNDEDGSE